MYNWLKALPDMVSREIERDPDMVREYRLGNFGIIRDERKRMEEGQFPSENFDAYLNRLLAYIKRARNLSSYLNANKKRLKDFSIYYFRTVESQRDG